MQVLFVFRINLSIESAYGSEALERLLRPNYWRIACREQLRLGYYELQELSETSERYRDVISIFRRTMKAEKVSVVSVNAVVNVGLWKRYMRCVYSNIVCFFVVCSKAH